MLEFEPFPKIGRLNAAMTVTEKIDGTNAQINFDAEGNMLVGSRKRVIFPEGTFFAPAHDADPGELRPVKGSDNFGFAKWAYTHQEKLFDFLGEGRHYGEWAGKGIQRGYGMDHKSFFLFNTARFGPGRQDIPADLLDINLDTVPVIYEGDHDADKLDDIMVHLLNEGSDLMGWPKPEGIIVYMHGIQKYHKMTFEHSKGKWTADADSYLLSLDELRL
jgi:hypothetical protein